MLGLVCILGIMHYVKQLSFIQSSQNLALLPQIFPVENNVKMSFVFSQFLETVDFRHLCEVSQYLLQNHNCML